LGALLSSENLRLALDTLHPYAHWVTPEFYKRRFDTRFFVAFVPDNQFALHDDVETVGSMWISPRRALDSYDRGEIELAPPTLYTLEELVPLESGEAVLRFAGERPIVRIEPRLLPAETARTLVLPGDSLYPLPEARGVYGPTRFVMEDGRWHTRSH
jgi:hypothetical protein